MIEFKKTFYSTLAATALSFCLPLTALDNNVAGNSDAAHVHNAYVILRPTQGNNVTGLVTFSEVDGGVKIIANIDNLTPGKHGFHVHEHGDCSAHDGSSAGAHFNPTGKRHGGPDDEDRHVGDFGNVVADENGHAYYERIDKVISLNGPQSIVGLSIVVHAGEDDLKSQPAGNSGARVACGVIEK